MQNLLLLSWGLHERDNEQVRSNDCEHVTIMQETATNPALNVSERDGVWDCLRDGVYIVRGWVGGLYNLFFHGRRCAVHGFVSFLDSLFFHGRRCVVHRLVSCLDNLFFHDRWCIPRL